MSTSTTRNRGKRSPYPFDDVFIQIHHSAAGIAWRWRTELTLLLVAAATLWRLALSITLFWAVGVLLAFVVLVLALPWTRRFTIRRFWCVLCRHRLQRVCYETRMHTRAGRIPLVLWIRPTSAGVRAHVLCRAGICAQDFADNSNEIAAACFSRAAQVTPNRNWSHLLSIDIMRGDLLHPKKIIPAHIAAVPDNEDIPSALSA
jgi:hypothetical protein